MQINANDTIEGVPILDIRDALRRAPRIACYYPEFFANRLLIPQKLAREVVAWLAEHDYLELVSKRPKEWSLTTKGYALANAKASQPIRRATAERALKAFMERVQEVNTNEYYLYRVTRVVLFGSYLSDVEMLGDVDIAIELQRKTEDYEEHRRLNKLRVEEAEARGRTFYWTYAEDLWGEEETLLFLKSRSRSLSLHYWQTHQKFIEASEHKTLYFDESEQQASST
jgi:predicted nucleotidyltransferase